MLVHVCRKGSGIYFALTGCMGQLKKVSRTLTPSSIQNQQDPPQLKWLQGGGIEGDPYKSSGEKSSPNLHEYNKTQSLACTDYKTEKKCSILWLVRQILIVAMKPQHCWWLFNSSYQILNFLESFVNE